MKRARVRLSLLTALWISVGMVLFAAIWNAVVGGTPGMRGLAVAGLLLFLVAGALFGGEANLAFEAANARIDELVRDGMRRDRRLDALEAPGPGHAEAPR